jgi:hypothetical protein
VLAVPLAEAAAAYVYPTARTMKIRDPQRSTAEQVGTTAKYLAEKTLTPGFAKVFERAWMAYTGEEGPGGQKWTAKDVSARLAGMRQQTIDLHKAFEFKLGNLAGQFRDASTIYSSKVERNLPPDKLEEQYREAEKSRLAAFSKMGEVFGHYQAIGLSLDKAIEKAKAAGISGIDLVGLLHGTYMPQKRRDLGKEALLASVKDMTDQQFQQAIMAADLSSKIDLATKYGQAKKEQALKWSAEEKLIAGLGTDDQLRFLDMRAKDMTPEQRGVLGKQLRDRGVLHGETIAVLAERAKRK